MAVGGNDGLHSEATLGIDNIRKNVDEAIKLFRKLKTESEAAASTNTSQTKTFDVKPLTEYQAGLLKIKQEALELAKQNAADAAASREKAAADKSASLALQTALREERQIRQASNAADKTDKASAAALAKEQLAIQKQITAEANRKGKDRSFSTDADGIKKLTTGYSGLIVTQDRSIKSDNLAVNSMNAKLVAYSKLSTEMAKSAASQGALIPNILGYTSATKESAKVDADAYAKRRLAVQLLAEEKQARANATAALKNSIRESTAEKGSLEQRKAALERLVVAYSRLTKAERESASGQRMNTIIKDLGVQINKLDPTKIERVTKELKKIPESLPKPDDGNLFSKLFESISSGALSILAPLALIGTVWTAVKAIFSHNVEMSDAFADVRRTAKLSTEGVNELANELKGLNTRTNLEGLLDIGFIGGRLGVQKKDLGDFIKQVDELAVVLKRELPGGAEAVAESLGKIVTIYKVTQAEGVSLGTALSKVGSNLLELAHSGPVTVKYLQDFTLGVAGTAASAKLSIPVISAYGAVLGESGQIASSAALSVTRLVTGLTTKTGKYAAIAQLADSTLTVEKFTKIVNTDTKQALDLFFKGLKSGNPVATEFAARLGSVGITTGKVTNAVKILAENQDKLADRIQKGTAAFEDGTSVAHNFEIANDTLGSSVDKLGNSIVNLTTDPNSNMYTFFKGVIDGATKSVTALDILLSTVKGLTTDPKKFIADSAKKSRDESVNQINEEAKKIAASAVRNRGGDEEVLNILKQEVKIRDIINTQYLTEKIALANNKDASLADINRFNETETKIQKQIALVRELNKIRNKGKVEVIGTGELPPIDDDVRTTDDIKGDIKDLELANKKLDVSSKEFKANIAKIKDLRKELKIALGGVDSDAVKAESEASKLIKSRNTLQKEIDKMIDGSSRKQMSSDDAEVQSVTDKYDVLKQKAKEYYDEVNKKIPKNKQVGFGLNLSKINGAEINEKQAVIDKQSNARFKEQLAQQTQDFESVEDYRLKYGANKAQERYTKEFNISVDTYQKQFSSAEAYAQKLEDIQTSILNKYGDPSGYSEAQKQELAIATENVKSFAEKRKSIDDANYSEAYQSAASLQEKLSTLDIEYATKKKAIFDKEAENGPAKSLAMYKLLDEAYKDDADSLIDSENSKSKVFKRLAQEALILTRSQITEQINGLQNAMKDITIPPDLKEKIRNTIGNLKIRLNIGVDQVNLDTLKARRIDVLSAIEMESKKATPSVTGLKDELAKLNSEIDDLDPKGTGKASGLKTFLNGLKDNKTLVGTATGLNLASDAAMTLSDGLGGVDTEAGYTLDTIGKLAGAAGDLALSIASGDPAKIIGSAIKAVGTLFSIGKKVKEMNAAARKEVADYYANAIAGEREYQDLLKERQIESVKANKIALQGIRDEVALRTEQTAAYKKEADEIMAKLSGQSYVSSESYTHGTWFRKASTNKTYSSLGGKTFAELSQLLAQGKLEGDAKALVERLKELEQKGYDADQAIADLAQQTSELFTGTTSDNLTNTLAEMFSSGKTSAKDLADFFKQSMDDAALSIFKNKVLAGAMEEFYKKFDAAAQSGDELTEGEIASLQLDFQTMTDDALKRFDDYKKITGSDLKGSGASTSNQSGIQGTITAAGLTEDTGNELKGIFRGQYDISKSTNKTLGDMYQIAIKQFNTTIEIAANTLRTANNTEPIKAMADDIKAIAANTTPAPGSSLSQALLNGGIKG